MAWIYLFVAGLFEIGWPLGLKLAQTTKYFYTSLSLSLVAIVISSALLYVAQKQIPIGIAYGVWTGIGAAGTFMVGVYMFNDNSSIYSWLGICLIILGIILLKTSH